MTESQATQTFQTRGGMRIERHSEVISYADAIEPVIAELDSYRGVLFASSYEYPGRYTRWDIGFVRPPLVITAQGNNFSITALNARGKILLAVLKNPLEKLFAVTVNKVTATEISGAIKFTKEHFPEELRSKQPSIFSVLRTIIDFFYSPADAHLGLYGAFGYDLTFQFDPIRLRLPRTPDQRDLVLYLPDEIYVVDHQMRAATILRYNFSYGTYATTGLAREGEHLPYQAASQVASAGDHQPEEYAACVRLAHEKFKKGDLFEVVPGQVFYEPGLAPPSELFRRLRERNPAPYGLFINLGVSEYLVGASPEMYVRVNGKRIETCPISGTIARGANAIADAAQILQLLNSEKDAAELTMCTDVDRNDKSRVCEPGSVRVIGRRQIEMYSRLIHTVDHVEGILREEFDALDGFLTHTWAVTVTGAPKLWAMQFIEDHERSPRRWYGGAIGLLGFNGDMNTGLTLRTIRIEHGIAEVRVGATLLYDSDPEEEEKETRLKASALLDAIRRPTPKLAKSPSKIATVGIGKRILLVDHQDSFVHTLANYLRQTGAEITTLRSGFSLKDLQAIKPDLVVLSPGPGCPADFNVSNTIAIALAEKLPIFGVCLGLQGLVEYFGGQLAILSYPMHGKTSAIHVRGGDLFQGLPTTFSAGRYHSLYAVKDRLPAVLKVTAETEDGVIMAIEHNDLPIWAVQFHPESILSLEEDVGLRLILNLVSRLNLVTC